MWFQKVQPIFFIENKKVFEKNNVLWFYHISSPISESLMAQLLLHRALTQKLYFRNTDWANPWDFAYQLSADALKWFAPKFKLWNKVIIQLDWILEPPRS